MNRFQHWLYRVQQRVAITRREALALLTVLGLLLAGMAARHFQRQPRSFPEEFYADTARQFAADTVALEDSTGEGSRAGALQAASPLSGASRIELNRATQAQLERLPYIGPVKAQRILDYREDHGLFERVQELERVRGIGPKTMERLEPLLFIDGEEPPADDTKEQ